jgi:hypothetical protein
MAQAYVEDDSFERDTDYIQDRITRDSRDGWPVEAGRYRLVAAKACPWATRSTWPPPSTTSAAGRSTSTPTGATRCSGSTC